MMDKKNIRAEKIKHTIITIVLLIILGLLFFL